MLLPIVCLLLFQFVLIFLVFQRQFLVVLGHWRLRSSCMLVVRSQRRGQNVINVMIIRQTTSSSRHSKVAVFRQDHVLRPETHLIVVGIVVHAAVEQDGQHVIVILNLRLRWIRLVPEVTQASAQRLTLAIVLVVKVLGAVVHDRHYVRIVVLIVVVERVEEQAQTHPAVRRSIHVTIIITSLGGIPECLQRTEESRLVLSDRASYLLSVLPNHLHPDGLVQLRGTECLPPTSQSSSGSSSRWHPFDYEATAQRALCPSQRLHLEFTGGTRLEWELTANDMIVMMAYQEANGTLFQASLVN